MPVEKYRIGKGAVSAREILDKGISSADINTGAVTASKIASNAVTEAKLKNFAYGTASINLPAIKAQSVGSKEVAFADAKTGDKIFARLDGTTDIAKLNLQATCPSDGTVKLFAGNLSAGTVNLGTTTLSCLILRM